MDNLMLATLKARQVANQLKTVAQVRDNSGQVRFQADGR